MERKKLYKIDPYYPSSQVCSICGYQNKKIKDLRIRKYTCPKCKRELDRDQNAAINILFEGIKKIHGRNSIKDKRKNKLRKDIR